MSRIRRYSGAAVVLLGVLCAVAATVAFTQRVPPARSFATDPARTPGPSPARHVHPGSASAVSPALRRSSEIAFLPARLDIPALHISAATIPVLSRAGQIQPPDDPQQLGWWQGSRLARSAVGVTVLVGHVDSATAGLGALYRLSHIRPGSPIILSAGPSTARYAATSLHYLPKTAGLPADLFTGTGAPGLVLITCGGPFDTATKSYRDNVIVTAAPAAR